MGQFKATDSTETRNRRTIFSVQLTNDVGPVACRGDPAQPNVRDFGKPRTGNGPYSVPIDDIRNEMDGQNGEDDPAGDGGVTNVEAKGR